MIELIDAAVKWNKTFFHNNAMPSYAVITKGEPLTEEQKAVGREFFANNFKGPDNSMKTLMSHQSSAESEIKFEKLTDSNKDGGFSKTT